MYAECTFSKAPHFHAIACAGATVTLGASWTYILPGVIIAVSPSSGQLGTVVEIAGVNLLGGGSTVVSVTLAGVEVDTILSASDDAVVVVVANASTSTVGSVVLTTDTGAVHTRAGGWRYLAPPNIFSISPASGQVGTFVEVSGEHLLMGATSVNVTFNNVPAEVLFANATYIRVAAGSGVNTSAPTDIVVTASTGAYVLESAVWTYLLEGTIVSVVPATGQHGTLVALLGARLFGGGTAAVGVTLAGIPATIVDARVNLIRVYAGESVASNITHGHAIVTSDTGALVTAENAFTYAIPGRIDTVTPASGQSSTLVTVQGA